MGKPIIAIDADDTLFDENNAVRLFHNEAYGTNHTERDYSQDGEFWFYWELMWGTERAESEKRYEAFVQWKLQHHLSPLPGALKTLKVLKQEYDLVVVTMRGERTVSITHEALAKYFPGLFDDVHFVPLWGNTDETTKAMICSEIGASYLIDDSFEHCKLAAEAGVKGLLFGDYGWNRRPTVQAHMTRLSNWTAVREYFDGKS